MATQGDKNKKVKRPTAQKRDLQNQKKRLRNRSVRASVKTAVRNFEDALVTKDPAAVQNNLSLAYSLLDKAVNKGVYTRNKANRSKARLAARVTP
jgi:small subunit ribosomal protein S20